MSKLGLWVEAYRPVTLEGYVFKNKKIEDKVREWIANPNTLRIPIPHILFTGPPGTGKSTISRILIRELHVSPSDVMEINASRESNVEVVRSKIVNFCSTWANGNFKIVFLDEFDGFNQQAQGILRGEMEKYSNSVRFIATANYPNKIIPALHSRFQSYHFDVLDMQSFIERLVEILAAEKILFDLDDLMPYVNQAYPDLRKAINLLELNVVSGSLQKFTEESGVTLDYMSDAVQLFRDGKYTEARQLICSQARLEDYEQIYQYFYRNLDMFSNDEIKQSQAVIYIAQGLKNHGLVIDPEIQLAATICELAGIK